MYSVYLIPQFLNPPIPQSLNLAQIDIDSVQKSWLILIAGYEIWKHDFNVFIRIVGLEIEDKRLYPLGTRVYFDIMTTHRFAAPINQPVVTGAAVRDVVSGTANEQVFGGL